MQPRWLKGRGYLRFDASGVTFVAANNDEELYENCDDTDIWALLDDSPLDEFGDPRVYNWFFLWTASPGTHESSTWRKKAMAELQFLDSQIWSETAATG